MLISTSGSLASLSWDRSSCWLNQRFSYALCYNRRLLRRLKGRFSQHRSQVAWLLLVLSASCGGSVEIETSAASGSEELLAKKAYEYEAFSAFDFGDGGSRIEYGSLYEGQLGTGEIVARVTARKGVSILGVKRSCGCASVKLYVMEESGSYVPYVLGAAIPMGAQIKIAATLDSAGKDGSFHSAIELETSPPFRAVTIPMEAHVSPGLLVSSRSVHFGQVPSGARQSIALTVTSKLSKSFELEIDTENLPDGLSAELCSGMVALANSDEEAWEVILSTSPAFAKGTFSGGFRLVSDIPRSADYRGVHEDEFVEALVYVSGEIVGPATLSPSHLSFGIVHPDQSVSRTFAVIHSPVGHCETGRVGLGVERLVLPLSSESLSFDASSADRPGTSLVTVSIAIPSGVWRGAFQGTLSVRTGCVDEPYLDIGYSGVVLDPTVSRFSK